MRAAVLVIRPWLAGLSAGLADAELPILRALPDRASPATPARTDPKSAQRTVNTVPGSTPSGTTSTRRHPRSLRTHRALQPSTLLSIEDFERALAAVDTGAGLPAILGTRLGTAYRRMPPSHFFARYFKTSRRPVYLDEQMRLVGDEARTALSLGCGE